MRPIDQMRAALIRVDPAHLTGDDIRALLALAQGAMVIRAAPQLVEQLVD